MSIPIIDTLQPLGEFPAVNASDVQAGNERLDTVLGGINSALAEKVDKSEGKGLSTNDYTTEEKNKLSGIEVNANNYVHPTSTGHKHIPSGGSSGKILGWAYDGTAQWVDNTEYSDATTSVHGLMSTSDKTKLDAIEAQATKTIVSTSVPATPTDETVPSMKLVADTYAVNSEVTQALNTKADSSTVSELSVAVNGKADSTDVTSLSSRVSDVEADQITLDSRMDTFTQLPSGSTSGDAELMDIRVKAGGATANSAGEAVREQVTDLDSDIKFTRDYLGETYYAEYNATWTSPTGHGADGSRTDRICTDNIPVKAGDVVSINTGSSGIGYAAAVWRSSISSTNIIRNDNSFTYANDTIEISNDGYICLSFAKVNSSAAITVSEFTGSVFVASEAAEKREINRISSRYVAKSATYHMPNFNTSTGELTLYSGTWIYDAITKTDYSLSNDVVLSFDSSYSVQTNFLTFNQNTKEFALKRHNTTISNAETVIGSLARWSGEGWTIFGLMVNGTVIKSYDKAATNSSGNFYFNYYSKTKCPNYNQNTKVLTIYSGTEIRNYKSDHVYALNADVTLNYNTEYDNTSNFIMYNPSTNTYAMDRYSKGIPSGYYLIGQVTKWGTGWTIGGLTINGTIANLGTVDMDNLSDDVKASLEHGEPTQSSWVEKYEDIRQAIGKQFSFCVQTDTHYDYDQSTVIGLNLKQLANNTGLDFVCNLGDILKGYNTDTTATMRLALSQIVTRYVKGTSCPVLLTLGNHDSNRMYAEAQADPTLQIDEDELYERVIAPSRNTCNGRMKSNGRSNYYYVDFDDAQIRVIVLNTLDGNYKTEYGNTFIFSPEQISWFTSVALNTNYAVVFMCHTPLVLPLGENAITNGDQVLNALKAFKANGKTLIGCFYGHTHSQDSVVDADGINHITFLNGGYNGEVVMIDQTERTINTIAINSGNNRSFSY